MLLFLPFNFPSRHTVTGANFVHKAGIPNQTLVPRLVGKHLQSNACPAMQALNTCCGSSRLHCSCVLSPSQIH